MGAMAQAITGSTTLAFGFRRETYERLAIGTATLSLLAFLPARFFFLAFIMLGQGHFLMTYLYQWKAGKMTLRYLALYALALGGLAWLASFVLPLPVLLLITGSVFALHFFYDEARLYARDNGVSLGLVWYPALLFLLTLVKILYAFDVLPAIVIATLLLILQYARSEGKENPHPSTGKYMSVFSTVLLTLLLAPVSISATAVLGAIILYHYMSWYVHYFFRLKDNHRPLRPYLGNGVLVNALVIGGFALYLLSASGPVQDGLGFVFAERYFYMWTLLHIFFASNEFIGAMKSQVLGRFAPRP